MDSALRIRPTEVRHHRDGLFSCRSRMGHGRRVERYQGENQESKEVNQQEENARYREALELIASCLCAVGSGCREPKLCVVCIARKALKGEAEKIVEER